MLEPSSKTIPAAASGGTGEGGNDGGGPLRGADGADAAGAQHGLGLAGGRPGAHQDAQRPPAQDPGDVLDGLAQPGGVVDRGVAQAPAFPCQRRAGGGGPGGDDQLVVAEFQAVRRRDVAAVRVDVAGRLAEADGDLREGGELQELLGGVIPVAEHRDAAGERGPGELADEGLRGRAGPGDDDPGPGLGIGVKRWRWRTW